MDVVPAHHVDFSLVRALCVVIAEGAVRVVMAVGADSVVTGDLMSMVVFPGAVSDDSVE